MRMHENSENKKKSSTTIDDIALNTVLNKIYVSHEVNNSILLFINSSLKPSILKLPPSLISTVSIL